METHAWSRQELTRKASWTKHTRDETFTILSAAGSQSTYTVSWKDNGVNLLRSWFHGHTRDADKNSPEKYRRPKHTRDATFTILRAAGSQSAYTVSWTDNGVNLLRSWFADEGSLTADRDTRAKQTNEFWLSNWKSQNLSENSVSDNGYWFVNSPCSNSTGIIIFKPTCSSERW